MAFYNPNAITHLVNEASPVGLEAILAKQEADGLLGPITFSSRSTTDVESRYCQTEREALAVLWGCQHFHHYVFDKHIVINTDHKPLVRLLSLNSNPPPHIQCWILHLEAYNYTIWYIPGNNNPADFLSHNTLNNSEFTQISVIKEAEEYTFKKKLLKFFLKKNSEFTQISVIKEAEEYTKLIPQSAVPKAFTQQEIKEVTANDTIL